jgi:sec-independent protein translocase protein TatB
MFRYRFSKEPHSMFNIGLPEMLVIVFVVVLFVDPKQLPGLFRNIGKGVQQIRRMREEFTRSMRDVQNDLGLTNVGSSGAPDGAMAERPLEAGKSGTAKRCPETWDEGGGI